MDIFFRKILYAWMHGVMIIYPRCNYAAGIIYRVRNMTIENTNKNRILVTGAAGFIGSNLCKRLLDENIHVIGIDNLNDYYDVSIKVNRVNELKYYKNFVFHKIDLFDMDKLDILFKEEGINIVVNLAAQAGVRYSIENPRTYMNSNLMGFFNILECCRYHKVEHLVYASSSSVYGGNKKVPYSVNDNVDKPISLYAATKKSNELLAHVYSNLYNIPCTGLRFFTVYGPNGRPDMAYYSFAQNIMNGKPIKVYNNGDMYRDFTYIDDVVDGIYRAIYKVPDCNDEGIRYKLYNIGRGKPEKLTYMIECLEKELGKKAIIEYMPMQPGDVYQTYADISESVNDLNYDPKIDLKYGIHEFAKWYINKFELKEE